MWVGRTNFAWRNVSKASTFLVFLLLAVKTGSFTTQGIKYLDDKENSIDVLSEDPPDDSSGVKLIRNVAWTSVNGKIRECRYVKVVNCDTDSCCVKVCYAQNRQVSEDCVENQCIKECRNDLLQKHNVSITYEVNTKAADNGAVIELIPTETIAPTTWFSGSVSGSSDVDNVIDFTEKIEDSSLESSTEKHDSEPTTVISEEGPKEGPYKRNILDCQNNCFNTYPQNYPYFTQSIPYYYPYLYYNQYPNPCNSYPFTFHCPYYPSNQNPYQHLNNYNPYNTDSYNPDGLHKSYEKNNPYPLNYSNNIPEGYYQQYRKYPQTNYTYSYYNYPYSKYNYSQYNNPFLQYNTVYPQYTYPYPQYNYQFLPYNYPYPQYNYQHPQYNYQYPQNNYQYPQYKYQYPQFNYHYQQYNYQYPQYNYQYPQYNYQYSQYNYQYSQYNNPYPQCNYPYPQCYPSYINTYQQNYPGTQCSFPYPPIFYPFYPFNCVCPQNSSTSNALETSTYSLSSESTTEFHTTTTKNQRPSSPTDVSQYPSGTSTTIDVPAE